MLTSICVEMLLVVLIFKGSRILIIITLVVFFFFSELWLNTHIYIHFIGSVCLVLILYIFIGGYKCSMVIPKIYYCLTCFHSQLRMVIAEVARGRYLPYSLIVTAAPFSNIVVRLVLFCFSFALNFACFHFY